MVSKREVENAPMATGVLLESGNEEVLNALPMRGGFRYMAEGLAHDLNNVFAPIMTSVEILRETAHDEQTREILDLIRKQVWQGSAMVEQIPSLARGIENAHSYVQTRNLLRDLRKFLTAALPKTIVLDFKTAPDLWPVVGSLAKLYQSLLNLCVNAGEAMPHGGTLLVSAENVLVGEEAPFVTPGTQRAKYVLITIKDTGKGIPEEMHERIFDPGYSTKTEDKGGLGLYFVETVVKAHGGHLTLESEVNQGTTFRLHLPAAIGEPPPLVSETGLAPQGHGEWILIADDEEALLRVTQTALELFGYNVITASNGADAVAAYLQSREKIKLVFTDMRMPVMEGGAVLRELRKINPELKLIATSGHPAAQQKLRTEEAGANRFLSKPYEIRQLLQALHELLTQESPAQAALT
jgi:two-component system, cell cycle sensor histidine kinase and response regulator CckA